MECFKNFFGCGGKKTKKELNKSEAEDLFLLMISEKISILLNTRNAVEFLLEHSSELTEVLRKEMNDAIKQANHLADIIQECAECCLLHLNSEENAPSIEELKGSWDAKLLQVNDNFVMFKNLEERCLSSVTTED